MLHASVIDFVLQPCDKSFVIKPALSSKLLVTHFRNLTLRVPTVLCTIFVCYIGSVMPKIRASSISEHSRRRVKVSSAVTNHSSSTLSLPSITTFTKRFCESIEAPNQSPTSHHQRHRYSQLPLMKPNVDRFNTRGRTIYNAFDCLSPEHSRLHRKLAHDKGKALPKETLCLTSSGVETAAKCRAAFKTDEKLRNEDTDILQQADLLFEMYIRME